MKKNILLILLVVVLFMAVNVSAQCFPDCIFAFCGDPDGCGGWCNAPCLGGMVCIDAVCQYPVCIPQCVPFMPCGVPDGCGGMCPIGMCPPGMECMPNGVCEETVCVPNCLGKPCGASDGCDGICLEGFCDGYYVCTNGVCQLPCDEFDLPGNELDEDCDGVVACDSTATWKNHGKYVSCVAKEAEALSEAGLITEEEKDALVTNTAKSSVGKLISNIKNLFK